MIKLTKKDLLAIGYVIEAAAGGFIWYLEDKKPEGDELRDRVCATEDLCIAAATAYSTAHHELHRCDNCGELHTEDQLSEIRHLSQRVDAGGIMPSGECAICKCLCYPVEKDEAVQAELPLIVFLDGQITGENLLCILAPAGMSTIDATNQVRAVSGTLSNAADIDSLTAALVQRGFKSVQTVTVDLASR